MIQKVDLSQVFQAQGVDSKAKHDLGKKLALQIKLLEVNLKHLVDTLTKVREMKIKEQEAILKAEQKVLKLATTQKNEELMKVCEKRIAHSQKALELAYKKAVAHARSKGRFGSSANPPSPLPGYFNPNVPGTWAGAGGGTDDPGSSVLGKLWLMLQYIEANPHNPAALRALQAYLMNIIKVYGKDPAKLAQVFNLLDSIQRGTANTFTGFIVKFLLADYYFTHGKNEAATLAYARKLLAELKGLGVPGLGSEISGIEHFIANIKQFVKNSINKTLADFLKSTGNALAELFDGSDINKIIGELRLINLKALLARYKGNPMIALMLWFFQEQDVQSDATLTGYAALVNYVENEINKLKGLEDKFNAGGLTGPEAKKWYQLLQQIKNDVSQNPALAGIFTNVANAINGIEGAAPGRPGSPTLKQLFDAGNFGGLAAAINKLSTGTGPVAKQGHLGQSDLAWLQEQVL